MNPENSTLIWGQNMKYDPLTGKAIDPKAEKNINVYVSMPDYENLLYKIEFLDKIMRKLDDEIEILKKENLLLKHKIRTVAENPNIDRDWHCLCGYHWTDVYNGFKCRCGKIYQEPFNSH